MEKYIIFFILTLLPHAAHGMMNNQIPVQSSNYTFTIENDGENEDKISILDPGKTELGWVDCSIKKANPTRGLIIHIYIEEAFRRQGLASKLLEKSNDHFKNKGCNEIELDVAQANEPSQLLFKKHGFTHVQLDDEDLFLPGDVFTFRKKL